jgi:NAD(P)H-dependent FMN reductase
LIHIIGIPGSLRQASYNAALLRAAAEVVPEGCTIDVASIRDIPLYDRDLESSGGPPPAVSALKQHILVADGVLLASPEYNNSIPGVLKNAVDWASRSPSPFKGKPVAVIGATPGRGGTALAQAAWLPVLRTLGMRPYFGKLLMVSGAADLFAADGRLVDDGTRDLLREFVAGFAAFVAASRG